MSEKSDLEKHVEVGGAVTVSSGSQPDVEREREALSTFPEGGRQAWLTVLGASLVQFCTFGYMNAFGVYQGFPSRLMHSLDFYVREYLTDYTPSDIGWIGGVQIFLAFGCGIFAGRAFDRGYFHQLMIGGALLHSFSFFMLSLSHESQYYQVFLSHGLGGGLGTGIVYIPSLTVVSHYFQRNRPLAMGIVTVGNALGAVLHPIMLNHLFHGPVGFHTGVRISAALNTALLCVANAIMRARLPPTKPLGAGVVPVLKFMRDPAYAFVVVGGLFVFCGLFFPAFFLQLDAVKHGVDRQFAFYCLSILNAASILGRVVPAVFAQKYGVFNVTIFLTVGMGVLIYCMGVIETTSGFVTFAVFFGFFFGGGTSLTPPMIGSLAKDMSEMGARIGTSLAISGIMGLFATPIAGALLTSEFHWWRPILFNGTAMMAGAALFMASRYLVASRKGTQFVRTAINASWYGDSHPG
ncbi:putative MFS general substrate transporter [Lyophyllum shimeji]|uniref:MFS general substrate transporter n=1 Tax=Lyophyllum shimeji TaxID=47721 RepID=A0A9P3PPE2_LYOSH|nr:putative MFS general substrate transporter [Lyophyllum shimeji]